MAELDLSRRLLDFEEFLHIRHVLHFPLVKPLPILLSTILSSSLLVLE